MFSLSLSLSLSQQTPLHTAAEDGNQYTMDGLVKLGADINLKDKDGVSETILLVMNGLVSVLVSQLPRKAIYALFVYK